MEIDGDASSTVLMYGHLDKQPAMVGWEEGLGPWTPVLRDGKLYGRGGADDGYAIFATVAAISAVQQQNVAALPHRGAHRVLRGERLARPSRLHRPPVRPHRHAAPGRSASTRGCGNYDQLWMTTSLRGSIVGNLHVEVLTEGVHSGDASGIVPSSFRIIRILLDRLEDATTGKIIPEWLHVRSPGRPPRGSEGDRRASSATRSGASSRSSTACSRCSKDPLELLLNRTWRPALSYIGQAGLPDLVQGGNVLRPKTSIKLSLRIPPTLDATDLERKLKELLESDPPYGAHVTFEPEKGGAGWEAPTIAPWLEQSVERASQDVLRQAAR